MFRVLAIAIPLCLVLGWSFSVPASAHQARPTIAASCTVSQTWTLDAPAGGVTVYSNQSPFPGPGPSNNDANVTVTLDASNNVCGFTLNASFTVTDPHTHNTVTVSAVTPCNNPTFGAYNPTTGALTLNGTLTLNNVPLFQGPQTTKCASLTTEGSVTTNGGVVLTGSRVSPPSGGNVTLVGQTTFGSGFFVVTTWTQFTGTFTRKS
jgi:hypothetical protein